MSLIVARKEADSIFIVSDTKLSLPAKNSKDSYATREARFPSSDVIKTAIISPSICLSFAGGEVVAEEAFKNISSCDTVESLSIKLLQAHIQSNRQTDFIIGVGAPLSKIYQIKKGVCQEVESAWIGSQRAFASFQSSMLGEVERQVSGGGFFNIEPSPTKDSSPLYSDMCKAMDFVIEQEAIPEVGGFRVAVAFPGDHFQYIGYTHSYFTERHIKIRIPEGAKSFSFPIGNSSAEEGGYNINFFRSEDPAHVGIHILQGNFGIIYSRHGGGLMRPRIYPDLDEVDFTDLAEDNFGVGPTMLSQSRYRKCVAAADESIKVCDFASALALYNKALRGCWHKERTDVLHRKALALVNLRRFSEVLRTLDEAVRHDPSYQNTAFGMIKSIQQHFGKK